MTCIVRKLLSAPQCVSQYLLLEIVALLSVCLSVCLSSHYFHCVTYKVKHIPAVRKTNWSSFLHHYESVCIRPTNVQCTKYSVSCCCYQGYDMHRDLRVLFGKLCAGLSPLYPKCRRKEASPNNLYAF